MRKVILSMMMSLDGFIEGPNGEMDWLPPFNDEEKWKDIHEEMWTQLNSTDTILLGRITYQIWEEYWPAVAKNPSSIKNDLKFSQYVDKTQKIVFSKTLKKVNWKNTRLISKNIAEEILKIKEQSGKNIVLAGGANIAQTFMNLRLIDEYIINIHPVILGKGKPLFKNITDRHKLILIGSKIYNSGMVGLYCKSGDSELK
jgi:dihydrofolate reductase